MDAQQAVFMWGSVIGFLFIMLYNIGKTIKNHCFFVGAILGILKGTIFGAAWFFAWPVTMWIFLWHVLKGRDTGTYIGSYEVEPDNRNPLEQLLCIQVEPVYDFYGKEIGTAKTFGDKIIDVDAPGVSYNDLERSAVGDLRIKF